MARERGLRRAPLPCSVFFNAFYFFSLKAGAGGRLAVLCRGGAFLVFLVFCLPASCCFAKARGAPASRSPAAWMPVDVMIAPSEDQFWTDMREGQMKLKIRVRRMKESRDMRGLSASRLLSFRWGRRGKRGLLRLSPALPGGWRSPLPSGRRGAERDGWRYKERRQLASGEMEASGERVEGERSPVPSHGQCAEALAEAASLVLQAAAGKELHGGGSSFRQVRGCLQRAEASAAVPALGSFPTWCGVR